MTMVIRNIGYGHGQNLFNLTTVILKFLAKLLPRLKILYPFSSP